MLIFTNLSRFYYFSLPRFIICESIIYTFLFEIDLFRISNTFPAFACRKHFAYIITINGGQSHKYCRICWRPVNTAKLLAAHRRQQASVSDRQKIYWHRIFTRANTYVIIKKSGSLSVYKNCADSVKPKELVEPTEALFTANRRLSVFVFDPASRSKWIDDI